jgi:DNA-binding NarL/FixJ family response regulator
MNVLIAHNLARERTALKRLFEQDKVIVFSEHPGAIREALIAGAHAFVCKREPVEELLNTVRAVGGLSPCYI